jgi:hypothetical protein
MTPKCQRIAIIAQSAKQSAQPKQNAVRQDNETNHKVDAE